MADIELVIKMAQESYSNIKIGCTQRVSNGEMIEAIKNGTPLPKGHGKIGDLDVLREEVSSWGMNDYEPSDFIDVIDQADTIIEADKESEI